MNFQDKTILVTGGTGSFGQKFAEIVFKKFKPKSLRIFSRGEYLQYVMAQRMSKLGGSDRLRFFIGDVRDRERLSRAMNGADIVIHAAALKQILAAEYNPIEAVKTNIDGSRNVIDAAIDNGVDRVVLISTDKAVNPVNLYGATKLCAEKLFIQANSYTGDRRTLFSCVRYGNVIGSRGSVIPLFLDQRKQGVLTVTSHEMTRFWITLDQVVHFVLQSLERMEGGEIFVPKIPSVKIVDLAKAIAPRAKLKIIGVRSGEKLHEELLSKEEVRNTKEFDSYYVVEPHHPFWNTERIRSGKSMSHDFHYSSDKNTQWMTPSEIKRIVKTVELEK